MSNVSPHNSAMPTKREVRIAVGSPTGRRSTVWKFSVQKNEIYILSRMFGSDAKVSLHSSGECQWSATGAWVKKVPGRRNAERHITKWVMPRPSGTTALHVFQVRIPETELRTIDLTENLRSVEWLPIPPNGHSVSLECYITPATENDPALLANLPCPYLFSLPLADGRWFTVLHHNPPLDGKDLEPLRNQMNTQAMVAGIQPKPEHRGSAFTVSEGTARGLIELCTCVG
jgi:hypothetical protein